MAGLGQHRDLAAREVHRGQPLARDRLERVVAPEEERGRGDVHADAQPPAGRRSTEKASSISVVSWSSMENAGAAAAGSPGGAATGGTSGKAQALREELEGEAAQEEVLGAGERADLREQLLRREPGARGRLVQRPPLERHLVRLEEEEVELRDEAPAAAVPASSDAAHASTCSCWRRFFSSPASAALRFSSGAAW